MKKFSVIFFLLLTACSSDEPYIKYCKNIETGVEFTYHSKDIKYHNAEPFGSKPYNIITDTDGFTHQVTYETLPDYICKKI